MTIFREPGKSGVFGTKISKISPGGLSLGGTKAPKGKGTLFGALHVCYTHRLTTKSLCYDLRTAVHHVYGCGERSVHDRLYTYFY